VSATGHPTALALQQLLEGLVPDAWALQPQCRCSSVL